MGLGVGLILAAVGAVLAFAVNTTVSGVDIHTIGWILLIVGIVGILLSLIFWSSWAGPGGFSRRRTTYYDEGPAGRTSARTRPRARLNRQGRCLTTGPVRMRQVRRSGSSR